MNWTICDGLVAVPEEQPVVLVESALGEVLACNTGITPLEELTGMGHSNVAEYRRCGAWGRRDFNTLMVRVAPHLSVFVLS